jgi:hypothetical protein
VIGTERDLVDAVLADDAPPKGVVAVEDHAFPALGKGGGEYAGGRLAERVERVARVGEPSRGHVARIVGPGPADLGDHAVEIEQRGGRAVAAEGGQGSVQVSDRGALPFDV